MKQGIYQRVRAPSERGALMILALATTVAMTLGVHGADDKQSPTMTTDTALLAVVASAVSRPPTTQDQFAVWRDHLVDELNAKDRPGPAVLAIMSHLKDSSGERDFFLLLPVLDHLARQTPDAELIVVLESMLRTTNMEDIDSRSLAMRLINEAIVANRERDPAPKHDMDALLSALDKATQAVDFPHEVAYCIFLNIPSEFYIACVDRAHVNDQEERREARWLVHVVDTIAWRDQHGFRDKISKNDLVDARRQLEALSKAEQWWARAYAAQVIVKLPQLADAGVIERLKRDPNPLVVRLASEVDKRNGRVEKDDKN